jgi:hypothetical protein
MTATPVVLTGKKEEAVLRVTPKAAAAGLSGAHTITIRATAMQEGKYPVISETTVSIEFVAPRATTGNGKSK